ncbi:MAG: ATP-dependent DNA helicase [Desulfobulbaceae bacterium]
MEEVFGPGGILSRHLDGYELRPGQLEMARAVHRVLADPLGDRLVVEAETGLGKTLAYLVPAVLCGRKVVVSTNTRNLQDQILAGEIPFIRKYIYPGLQAMCVKGRQNYLCLHRWHQYQAEQGRELYADGDAKQVALWLEQTEFADRSEMRWLGAGSPLWQRICCLSDYCPGSDCPEQQACYLSRLRREAARSDLLVVNHHLLFSDLAVRRTGYGEVLPRYEAVIFDEAHHVEDVATTFFGRSVSRYQVMTLVGDVERSIQSEGGAVGRKEKDVLAAAGGVIGHLEHFLSHFPPERGRFPLGNIVDARPGLEQARDALVQGLGRLADILEEGAERKESWEQHGARARNLAEGLATITTPDFSDLPMEEKRSVQWYERRERNFVLSSTPVEVADELRETLYSSVPRTIFTSATLAARGDFSYFRQRMGLDEDTESLCFPSPYDYSRRSLLYVPEQEFPEPNGPGYAARLHERIAELVRLSGGRALVLFTSIQAREAAHAALRDRLGFPLLVQGEAPRRELLARFAGEQESVLFAVASFWEGVDVPGASLSLVIIDKLPFEVPTDPVIMARMEKIRAAGGNPFHDFQVPRAILTLRQGVGRLIRSARDSGVMAILDVRLFTKGYGRRFLRSLPPAPLSRELEAVRDFFYREGISQHGSK